MNNKKLNNSFNITCVKKVFCKYKTLLVTVLCLIPSMLTAKPVNIDISKSSIKKIPIAFIDFEDGLGFELASVIENDLESSGQFNKIKGQLIYDISSAYEADANYVIRGHITDKMFHFDLTLQLIDLDNDSEIILNYQANDILKKNKRKLAHLISDKVFHKIIGIQGFFSTKVAYVTADGLGENIEYKLYVADADFSGKTLITSSKEPLMSPNWSPNNDKLAFVRFEKGKSSVRIIDLKTKHEKILTSFPGINGAPKWSPDGKKLALVLSKDGVPKVYVYSFESSTLQRITGGYSIDTEPAWSPDGKELFFTSNKSYNPHIYKYILDEKTTHKVTTEGKYNSSPSITPDGKKMVFLHKSNKGSFNVAVYDFNTKKVNVLYKAAAVDAPTIAPNGSMILYGTNTNKTNSFSAISLDGSFKMKILMNQPYRVKDPSWSYFFDSML